ncbi:glutathione S-transferase family protein [Candidatus Halobonum tyrrellensis]|uniref:Glutathione transferase n=1 Tax=Candidatus Halobonum tyrrellensis G22 TaxID=1324957 RepID=V4HIQ3_9EURY|nr:glutathione S-transferase family protein [Candidatus Halobonum tyrrellensis]ESP89673.1 glutathione transferase [Candidatus Halobonum tyrrellensis G22]
MVGGSEPADTVSDATNMLVDGEWRTDVREDEGDDGSFERSETSFRNWLDGSVPEAGADPVENPEFPAEPGRYHLYICRACPWAHRAAMTRALNGLEDAISVSLTQPERYDDGWEFSDEQPDPLYGAEYLREIYTKADDDYTGRVTVPVLWDKESETIVNNESEEIMRMLDTAFDDHGNGVDLYPADLRAEIDERIADIYPRINNGVYRAGFAGTQAAYDDAVDDLFDALDEYEELLGDRRYVAGERLTEADVVMFATLVRFDHVYHTHFRCNRRAVHEYPNLWEYAKDVFQTPGVEETVNLDHITRHYYKSHPSLNPKRIVPTGPDVVFSAPHDRDRLVGGPPAELAPDASAD